MNQGFIPDGGNAVRFFNIRERNLSTYPHNPQWKTMHNVDEVVDAQSPVWVLI